MTPQPLRCSHYGRIICVSDAHRHTANERIGERARAYTHTHAYASTHAHTIETLRSAGPIVTDVKGTNGVRILRSSTMTVKDTCLAPPRPRPATGGGDYGARRRSSPRRICTKILRGKTLTSDYRNLFQPCFCRLDHSDEFCSSQQVRAQ